MDVLITRDDRLLFVANNDEGSMSVIDLQSGAVQTVALEVAFRAVLYRCNDFALTVASPFGIVEYP